MAMAATLTLQMPPDVAANAKLATQVVTSDAPSWAIAHDAVHPHRNGHFEVMGSRNYQDIFRLPNMGGVVRNWLFTRPTMEAVGEESFSNVAVESTTLFRIENVDNEAGAVTITPTVSTHWLLVPCQTVNGYTVGLAYLDVTYERDEQGIRDNRVPHVRLGRFVIEDDSGEIFLTGWDKQIMVVGWTQSFVKCERVRELLLFEAPRADGEAPSNLLLRNSFFERRNCSLCGQGSSISTLPPPCSGVTRSVHDATRPAGLTKLSALYRRFRGAFFGVCLKTRYGEDRQPNMQQLVPIFVDAKHGLNTVKTCLKNNLRKNVLVLGDAYADGYFGVNPRSATRLLLLRANHPVDADCDLTDDNASVSSTARARSVERHNSPRIDLPREKSSSSTEIDNDENAPKRIRDEDPLERHSITHKRKVRNRMSAQRSNELRKMLLEQRKAELEDLKRRLPQLREKYAQLQTENQSLRSCLYVVNGNVANGREDDDSGRFDWAAGLSNDSVLRIDDDFTQR